ncbi:MAG: hypothetical protein KFH87_06115 [Bacteroidetes bacterium]|nr:hypothetical protein [Bacteroidota bacterium]
MTSAPRNILLLTLAALLLAACVPPTEPDTPRRRISEPAEHFLRTLDLSEYDRGFDLQQLEDGGFIVAGRAWMRHTASIDVLLVRTDPEGAPLWYKTFGGVFKDEAYAVRQTSDGGFIFTGNTESYTNGFNDVWLVKTDENGSMQWSRSFGGSSYDSGQDVIECANGGYLVVGYTEMSISGNWYASLIRTDELGNEIWSRVYGGGERDYGASVIEMDDGGFVVTGSTATGGSGNSMLWLFKVAANGDLLWEHRLLKDIITGGYDITYTDNGLFGVVGYAFPRQQQRSNMLFVLIDASGDLIQEEILHHDAVGTGITAAPDGGFVLSGYTDSFGSEGSDIVLVKIGVDGNEQWKRMIGGDRMDRAMSITTTSAGGYALTGTTRSFGSGREDMLLIKTDASGFYED